MKAKAIDQRPSDIALEDLNASFILDFPITWRSIVITAVAVRTRFAAIRSFMQYVSFEEPSALALAQSILATPMKRFEQPLVGFLFRERIEVILAAPDAGTWTGQRDRVMLNALYAVCPIAALAPA